MSVTTNVKIDISVELTEEEAQALKEVAAFRKITFAQLVSVVLKYEASDLEGNLPDLPITNIIDAFMVVG